MFLFITLVGVVIVGVVWTSHTRAAQLKRMARTLNLRYDPQVDSVLSPEASAKAQFFNRGLHQFYQVLTFRDPGAFVRVCQDRIFSSPLDKKPLHTYTLVTAELTKDTFPPFVLMPRTQDQAPGTNLPADLSLRYTLSAPEGFALPDVIIGFLKMHPACYVECTQTSLLYCEFTTASIEQVQPLHFKCLELVKALAQKTQLPSKQTPPQPAPVPQQFSEEELQAKILLKLTATSGPSATPLAGTRYVYGLILLVLLGGLLLLTWYALHYGVSR